MRRALIGHTGFVGSNLNQQCEYSHCYNSKNIGDIKGEHFEEIVCAGIQAVKWWSNQNPKDDWAGIEQLISVLDSVSADRFTLISTVDVYKTPVAVNESSPIETDGLQPYGLHRWKAEEWARAHFPQTLILRLPGLFGKGLKKNLIFDVLTDKDLSGFDARASFQFYDLAQLGSDLATAQAAELNTLNIAVQPVTVASVVDKMTGSNFTNKTGSTPAIYDMQTNHASLWGKTGAYLYDADDCLERIDDFCQSWHP